MDASSYWCRGGVIITTAQLLLTKPKFSFLSRFNPVGGVSEVYEGETVVLAETIPLIQFIIFAINWLYKFNNNNLSITRRYKDFPLSYLITQ